MTLDEARIHGVDAQNNDPPRGTGMAMAGGAETHGGQHKPDQCRPPGARPTCIRPTHGALRNAAAAFTMRSLSQPVARCPHGPVNSTTGTPSAAANRLAGVGFTMWS